MPSSCKRCGSEIVELSFSKEHLLEIWQLITQNIKLFAVKKMMAEYGLEHIEAKFIVMHFNTAHGKCHRCNSGNLEGENIECPKCKAFNYNQSIDSFY